MARRSVITLLLVGLVLATVPARVWAEDDQILSDEPVGGAYSGEDPQALKDKLAALEEELEAAKTSLKTSASAWQNKLDALKKESEAKEEEYLEQVAQKDASLADLTKELKEASTKLAALEAEHDASPVPPVVVLAFARGRRVLSQATELYYEHAHVHTLKARSFACGSVKHVQSAYKTHVGPAAEKLLLHGAKVLDLVKAEYREHAAPTVEKALHKAQLFAADAHAHLAKHETLGEYYRKAHQVATKLAERLQEGYAASSVHLVRAVDELETLLRGILAQYPSTRPYSVKHYPRLIVKALLALPLIALTIVILGGRKKAPKSKKAGTSSPASSQTTSSRKHTPSKGGKKK